MDGLPFLPGNSFTDPTKGRYHRSHTLGYKNGYSIPTRPEKGIGGVPIPYNQLSEKDLDDLANFRPTLTYGQAKQAPPEDFVPAHVAWDKKVLKFNAYFKQTVHESPKEHYRVRPVNIYYYLEDDSISVVEPVVENSGMPQGKLIKRQRLPKNDEGDHWVWKDLNLGVNVVFYGKVFRITDCDKFTTDFLESEGIIVNPSETLEEDPYIGQRTEAAALKTFATPSAFDKLRQFLELDRKVLRFYALWDDRDSMFGEIRPIVIHYYLVDDTLEVREVHTPNDGRDPFPILITRHKVPKNREKVDSSFPAIVMEYTDSEIKEYFTARDFMIGNTVQLYNRRVLIYDWDKFTMAFYHTHFGVTSVDPIDVRTKAEAMAKMELPPYNGYGSIEDSMQSCLSLIPQPPKKDFIKMLENDHSILRFGAIMDSVKPEDKGRRFIISYHLADDMMSVYEPQVRNSGIIGGKFLEKTRCARPESTIENPRYYGPNDFKVGEMITIFNHRFIVQSADVYVLKYMEEHKDQFSPDTIQSLRDVLSAGMTRKDVIKGAPMKIRRTPGDLERLCAEVKGQLKKMVITDKNRIDEMFLRYNSDRQGYVDGTHLKDMCLRLQLPADDDVIDMIVNECGSDGKIDLEQFRKFFEST
ncbi:EF-hand domain-containing protein 1-like [Lineus longissimus]|uniref:EF-hand domain-containing protein 1-like n=1 Tax=Lineus longissimus TaxID=88925 RepID=UPI00315DCEBD